MLRTYIIDDEMPALLELEYLLKEFDDVHVEGLFQNPVEALEKIKEQKPDIVFIDIDMPYMNGIELALKIQSMQAGVTIIFVTAFSSYALEAFKAYPLDYILKPVNEERFRKTVRYAIEQHEDRRFASDGRPRLTVQCFGRLAVKNADGNESMNMSNRKLRELFAYLLDRFDKPVTRKELLQVLFDGVEDKKTINHLHVTVYKLRSMLEGFASGRSAVLITDNYKLEVAPGICDYVDFANFVNRKFYIDEENIAEAERILALYTGDYLQEEDYIWSVETREWLYEQFEGLLIKIAEHHDMTGKSRRAEQLLIKLLDKNPLSERGNHMLLDLYHRQRSTGKYIKRYNQYLKILKEELNTVPDEKYRSIYKKMLTNI